MKATHRRPSASPRSLRGGGGVEPTTLCFHGNDKKLEALVDRLILEQGRLDPLELLLATETLAYEDYEAWRLRRLPSLQGRLPLPVRQTVDLLDLAQNYARVLGLTPTPLHHLGWGADAHPLTVGPDQALARACAEAYAPAEDRAQLDLFFDSRVLVLENRVCDALAERRPAQALKAIRDLQAAEPDHHRLGDFLHLIQVLDTDAPAAPATRLAELKAVEPLAADLLRHRARDFLAPLWADLAASLAGRPFDQSRPDLFPADILVRAGRWGAARTAVEADPDWRSHPPLVLIHAEACRRALDHTVARRDWFGLCWQHPEAAAKALDARDLPDRALAGQWLRFCELEPPLDVVEFPAWLLCIEPGLRYAVPVDAAPAGAPGEPYRLLHRLVGGEDTISLRQALAEANPGLLQAWLARPATR